MHTKFSPLFFSSLFLSICKLKILLRTFLIKLIPKNQLRVEKKKQQKLPARIREKNQQIFGVEND
jgi:hypothetical protein